MRSTQPATSTLEDLLDQSILVNIFPLIAAYNGERARNIPQVPPQARWVLPLPHSAAAPRSSAPGEACGCALVPGETRAAG